MAYVITPPCVGVCDAACVKACPCDCIHGPLSMDELAAIPEEERPARLAKVQLFIDPDHCIDCDACAVECPVDAIYPEAEVPEEWHASIEANARFFA